MELSKEDRNLIDEIDLAIDYGLEIDAADFSRYKEILEHSSVW